MKQTVWNLIPLFESDDDPQREEKRKIVEQKSYAFINKWRDRKDYLEDPSVLRQALDEYEEWSRHYGTDGNEGYYFWLRSHQDENNPALKAKLNKIEDFARRIQNDVQFFHLRLGKIPPKRQKRFLAAEELKDYRHFLERIFAEAKYLLTEAEEKILNLKAATSYSNWVRMTSGFLAKEERTVFHEDGKKKTSTFSELLSLMNSKNKKVRDSAAKAFNDILLKHADVAEAEINSVLANKKTDDELRKIPRPDLSRHINDDVDSEVVDTLLTAVANRFNIPARFYTLKAGLLGAKRLRYHERNVEYGDFGKKYSYAESLSLVDRVFRKLDSEFPEILSGFVKNGQFDVYPRKGKGSGAFCAHHLISQPTYILLNHTDTLNDVLTLAHELGHGINNELIKKKQNALNFGTPTSTAEVASTFMEDFVLQEILRKADDELRLSIMVKKLNDDVSTIFRQVACYRFEQELHHDFRQKGYLSKEEIGTLFRKHMAAYMGDAVEQSPGSGNWWAYWSHIRAFFYVYSYAGGMLISKSLQNAVKGDPRFIGKVKDFLSAGLSDSPRNIFLKLGIDITDKGFWDRGLDEIEGLLQETTDLARRLGKIR
ncbi:MAG: M3 family oligoendopeptidase [Alphaproteobacteria bacterium]|uniref:M3 family oligoendopeptidase n=1 Tax=Candidatus Nitrobium versatile TaxID=2884831 RepID=A0A953JFT8_9BACT|nr:M3 family oligoendopeptidase [Candidatus Nitrobium versatile]